MIKRLFNVFRGIAGLFIGGIERRNPEALLEIEKENLRKQIAQYNQGLAEHAGLCERLMSQVKQLEKDENELRAKTTANLRVGNKEAAGQMALRLQTVTAQLKENRAQLESAEKTYQELVRAREVSVRAAQDKVEEDRQRAAGRARVARDSLDTGGFAVKEAEQKALADQALADFAAKEGLSLEPAAQAEAPAAFAAKTMGPESQ
jgi:phage shock protein A